MGKLADFHTEFMTFIEGLNNSQQNDQILLKKLIAFIQGKNGHKLTNFVYNMILYRDIRGFLKKLHSQIETTCNKINTLFKADFISKFIRLSEKMKWNENLHLFYNLVLN